MSPRPWVPRDRPTGIPGVRIVFTSPGSTENQTLYYFQFNLANVSLDRNQQFVSFLKSFGPITTFTKAASYLMFKPHFSAVRQFILDQSLYVLQGDSGIPLRYFDPAGVESPVLRDLHRPHRPLQQLLPGGYGRYLSRGGDSAASLWD